MLAVKGEDHSSSFQNSSMCQVGVAVPVFFNARKMETGDSRANWLARLTHRSKLGVQLRYPESVNQVEGSQESLTVLILCLHMHTCAHVHTNTHM